MAFTLPIRDSYEAAIRIIESRKFPLELMHSHTMSLHDAEKALLILGNEVAGEQACISPPIRHCEPSHQ